MISIAFIKNAIFREDGLFLTIYKFNERISEYVDKSHVVSIPYVGEYWDSFCNNNRVQEKLSKFLLKYFALENKAFYEFEDPRLRIALLERSILNNLLIYAGAVIYSEQISKIIMKKDVLDLKESIGEDLYFFASKKASLVTGFAPRISGIDQNNNNITKKMLFEAGKECLQMCLINEDERLLKRLILKFPSDVKWDFQSLTAEDQKTKAWNFLYKILIKEVKPDIQICFT